MYSSPQVLKTEMRNFKIKNDKRSSPCTPTFARPNCHNSFFTTTIFTKFYFLQKDSYLKKMTLSLAIIDQILFNHFPSLYRT